MNDVLKSLKSDLTSRRLLPMLVLAIAALVAAGAYAALGGGSGSGTPVASVPPSSSSSTSTTGAGSASTALATAASPDPTAADSETTSGTRYQHQGGAHNPFVALPQPVVKKTVKVTGAVGSSGTSSSSGSSTTPTSTGTKGSGGTTPTSPTPTKPKPKPTVSYEVAVQFGVASTTPGVETRLNTYAGIQRLTPLPTATDAVVVFTGVSASGKGATFALMKEVILKGDAGCLPSASQCQVVDLAPGATEELGYLAPDGTITTYLLKVVSIVKQTGSGVTARVAARAASESKAGRTLLRRHSPPVLAELRFSPLKDVVVYTAAHKHH